MSEEILEFEGRQTRSEVAVFCRSLAEQLDGDGPVTLAVGDLTATVRPASELDVELELEREWHEEDEQGIEFELELEWTESTEEPTVPAERVTAMPPRELGEREGGDGSAEGEEGEDEPDEAGEPESKGRFELFVDRAGEWRWRMVHRNGNVIATGAEGYSRKAKARQGLESVRTNAPGAPVVEK
ncbi:HVO_2922 family protein [Natronorarus salvus]|uniref:HVO_2922 family protein n=1 Tax=Natronorarus salvus TaxID=3117733 RepID=UPI002F26C2F9